jgi:MYXO-CTERM domain-containing protein
LRLGGKFDPSELPALAPRLDVPAARGEIYTAVGFGDALSEGDPGVRRVRDGLSVVCGSSDCGSGGVLTNSEFVGEEAICEGDSGGPALDASERVIGVVSRGADNCGVAVYSAVAYWRDWMVATATRAATLGDYPVPGWAASGESLGSPGAPPLVATGVAPGAVGTSAGDTAPSGEPSGDGNLATRASSGGCSTAPGSSGGGVAALAMGGLSVLWAGARRRRSRRQG